MHHIRGCVICHLPRLPLPLLPKITHHPLYQRLNLAQKNLRLARNDHRPGKPHEVRPFLTLKVQRRRGNVWIALGATRAELRGPEKRPLRIAHAWCFQVTGHAEEVSTSVDIHRRLKHVSVRRTEVAPRRKEEEISWHQWDVSHLVYNLSTRRGGKISVISVLNEIPRKRKREVSARRIADDENVFWCETEGINKVDIPRERIHQRGGKWGGGGVRLRHGQPVLDREYTTDGPEGMQEAGEARDGINRMRREHDVATTMEVVDDFLAGEDGGGGRYFGGGAVRGTYLRLLERPVTWDASWGDVGLVRPSPESAGNERRRGGWDPDATDALFDSGDGEMIWEFHQTPCSVKTAWSTPRVLMSAEFSSRTTEMNAHLFSTPIKWAMRRTVTARRMDHDFLGRLDLGMFDMAQKGMRIKSVLMPW